jgi:hypothetical protein
MLKKDCVESIVNSAYRGILHREPDESAAHYVREILELRLSIEQLFSFFTSLDEFYERCAPIDRGRAISNLYGHPYANSYEWRNTDSKLIYWHMPKTGGISAREMISKFFHPLQIAKLEEEPPKNESKLAGKNSRDYNYFRFYSKHFSYQEFTTLASYEPNARKMISFRAPEARLVSLYWFLRSIYSVATPPFDQAAKASIGSSLDEFFASENPNIINIVDNYYVRSLTGLYATQDFDPLYSDPNKAINSALEIVQTFDAIYFLEELPKNRGLFPSRILNFLSENFGIYITNPLPMINVSSVTDKKLINIVYVERNTALDRILVFRIKKLLGVEL